jgi:hypothetical protein
MLSGIKINYGKDANGELRVDFVVLSYNNTNMIEIRDDMSVFTNVKETSLATYTEKRDKFDENHNSTIDNLNTTNLLKWKIEKLEDGKVGNLNKARPLDTTN